MEMDLNCSPLHSLRANYHKAHLTKVRQTVSVCPKLPAFSWKILFMFCMSLCLNPRSSCDDIHTIFGFQASDKDYMRSHYAKCPRDHEHSHIGWHRIVFAFGIRPVFRSSATFSVDLESERVCPLVGGNLCPLATAGTAPASGFISLAAKLPFCVPSRVFLHTTLPCFYLPLKKRRDYSC